MELIREIKESDIDEKSQQKEVMYKLRKASRNIIFNNIGEIALLYVAKKEFHKLPGGGIEDGEDIITALHREELEEVGAQSEVIGEVGAIVEYRDQSEQLQISYCYYSKVKGECGEPSFTEKEKEEGCKLKWVDFDSSIGILENDAPNSYFGKFMKERDLTFLRKAKELNIIKKIKK